MFGAIVLLLWIPKVTLSPFLGDQTHLGHHKPTHLGHHRQHFCERVVTGGHSLRSPTQAYYIPLGLDMGTWGLGDMGRDMGTWGHGV